MVEDRILFKKGKQKEFLDLVKSNLNVVSVRGILQFGLDLKYSTLKDYYSEKLLLPKGLFENLIYLAKIKKVGNVKYIKGNWGQIKGGKARRVKI